MSVREEREFRLRCDFVACLMLNCYHRYSMRLCIEKI